MVLSRLRRLYPPEHRGNRRGRYNLACSLALQGRREETFSYLRESVDPGLPVRTSLGIDAGSDLKSLHDDLRFAAIVCAAHEKADTKRQNKN
jgi:hypothetical protein